MIAVLLLLALGLWIATLNKPKYEELHDYLGWSLLIMIVLSLVAFFIWEVWGVAIIELLQERSRHP